MPLPGTDTALAIGIVLIIVALMVRGWQTSRRLRAETEAVKARIHLAGRRRRENPTPPRLRSDQ